MRVLHVHEEKDSYVADLHTVPDPTPGTGERVIRVAASGVNRADLSQIAGRYPAPAGEPQGLGLEVSGILETTGERVCALLAGGGHADRVVAPEGQIFPAPSSETVDLVHAAAIPEAFLTAYINLAIEAGLERGETVLVHAGASGVGLAAIQVAKYLGARVAATTRTATKISALEQAGADLALHVADGDFTRAIEAQWGKQAIDVVLDPVGGPALGRDLDVLQTRGRIVFLATMAGAKAELDISVLMKRRGRVIGSTLRARSRAEKAELIARFTREILPGFARGALAPRVDAVFPPERAVEAFQRMRENRTVGKLLIEWGQLA